jgi:acyl-CoA thioester hydrolase
MPRPDPALLLPERYTFDCTIETRFQDVDANRHINNVALIALLEEARVRFHRVSGSHEAAGKVAMMVASIAVEFVGQSYFPDPLHVHILPSRLGKSSYTLDQFVTQNGRAVAFAQATMVCVVKGKALPIPDTLREIMISWMGKT